MESDFQNQVELFGSTIGILGVCFLHLWSFLFERTSYALKTH